MKFNRQALIGAGCGLLVGVLMTAPLKICFRWTYVGDMIWGLCNPAAMLGYGLSMLWPLLGLPPHGEAGYAVVFVSVGAAIVAQWVLVGTIVGLLIAHRYFKVARAICAVVCVAICALVCAAVLGTVL